jgi:hypothetical protein
MFSGGGSAPPAEAQSNYAGQQQQQNMENNCGPAAMQFTKCLDENGGNMQICNWYLEQLVSSY